MVEKGFKYSTEDGKIRLEKCQKYVRTVRTVHGCMDKYEWRFYWGIYGLQEDGHDVIYTQRTLNEAKRFVEEKLTRELGELLEAYSIFDNSIENVERGERIRELRRTLGCVVKPKACRRPPIVVNR